MPSNGERLRSSGKCATTGTNKGRGSADSIHKNCIRYLRRGNEGDQAVLGRMGRISRTSQTSACNARHEIVKLGKTTSVVEGFVSYWIRCSPRFRYILYYSIS